MKASAEIRWFFPGSLPSAVLRWFSVGKPLVSEGIRQDAYLLFPGCDTVGVKLREGKLEVKALMTQPRPLHIGVYGTGRIDQWMKWTYEPEGLEALTSSMQRTECWVQVSKERYTRRFASDAESLVEVFPTSTLTHIELCQVEVTQIDISRTPARWFSLGFEASGSPVTNGQRLEDILSRFFQTHGPFPCRPLTGRESLSYPTWLGTFPVD